MPNANIFEETRILLAKVLKVDQNKIGLESKLQDDLGIDSVDFWDVITSFDKKFKARISQKEALSLVTVADLINALQKKIEDQQ